MSGRTPKKKVPPPPDWIERVLRRGTYPSAEAATAVWYTDTKVRDSGRRTHNIRLRVRAAAVVKAAAGDVRSINLLAKDGNTHHPNRAACEAANLAGSVHSNARASAKNLALQLKHARCSIDGCPLSNGEQLVRLLHFTRTTGEKGPPVTRLRGDTREAEVRKSTRLCIYHHHNRLKHRMKPAGGSYAMSIAYASLRRIKEEKGCEYPHHDSMPYASLVPKPDMDPTIYGFFEVSHVRRGRARKLLSNEELVADINRGDAVVHCKFCHALYTLCESAQMYTTPSTQHQFGKLRAAHPEFVAHFEQATSGFDWGAEKERIGSLISKGKKRRHGETKEREDEE